MSGAGSTPPPALEGTSREPDEEAAHDLRIAIRRLRAALRHLGPCLQPALVGRAPDALRAAAGEGIALG